MNSPNVKDLESLSRELYDLNGKGIRLTLNGPDFYVSGLDEVKIDLMKRATKNGRDRAEIMAKSSGEKLGSLVSARQGVIQITKPNSTRTSSYGIYDTETIEKVVKCGYLGIQDWEVIVFSVGLNLKAASIEGLNLPLRRFFLSLIDFCIL